MKIYLVGGAVRDQALGIPIVERDWVVVGSTPEEMIAKGYKQVGRDFPVFIHPDTGEEYALARKERKSGKGYHGFLCDFSPDVTLEEDLARRDLTINAMALDENGQVVDPYHGMVSLQEKQLLHVSSAFIEDPVRILRVARFAARFHHLGFKIAEKTRELMYAMVMRQEVDHLTAERVWQEWQKALSEKNPEVFMEVLRTCGALHVILPELDRLFGVPRQKKHQDDARDVGLAMLKRTMYAARQYACPMIRFSALMLEIGQGETPHFLWPFHPDYVERGIMVADELGRRLRVPNEYRTLARLGIQLHLNIEQGVSLDASKIVNLIEQADAFRKPARFHDLLRVCETYHQDDKTTHLWELLLKTCVAVTVADLKEQYQGVAIRAALHRLRIEAVELQLKQWISHEK